MNPKHQNYLNQAEEIFYGANGQAGEFFAYDGDDDFSFNPQVDASNPATWNENVGHIGGIQYAASGDQSFSANGGAEAAVTIPDFDRTYTITITNTIAVNTPITIFGANQFLTAVNFGLPATVTIAVGESTYQELLFETQTSPFTISGFRMTSDSNPQLDQVLQILKRDGNGQRCSYPLQIGNYFSAFQFQAGIREVYPYNITFAGTTQMSFTLLASATVVLTLFVGKRLDIDNKLHGKPITGISPYRVPFVGRQQLTLAPNTIAALKGGA